MRRLPPIHPLGKPNVRFRHDGGRKTVHDPSLRTGHFVKPEFGCRWSGWFASGGNSPIGSARNRPACRGVTVVACSLLTALQCWSRTPWPTSNNGLNSARRSRAAAFPSSTWSAFFVWPQALCSGRRMARGPGMNLGFSPSCVDGCAKATSWSPIAASGPI